MGPGVGYPSYRDVVTWTASNFLAGYPVANLQDLVRITKVGRTVDAATLQISWTSATKYPIQMVSLIHHTFGVADTVQLALWSTPGTTGTVIYDSGIKPLWPLGSKPVIGYPSIRPFVFDEPMMAASGTLVFSMAAQSQIGGIDIGGFFELPVGWERQRNIIARQPVQRQAGGTSRVFDSWNPRTYDGQVSRMKIADAETLAIDFQAVNNLRRPFVFVESPDSPASWPRTCMLARNQSLPSIGGASFRRDKFEFHFIEHLR